MKSCIKEFQPTADDLQSVGQNFDGVAGHVGDSDAKSLLVVFVSPNSNVLEGRCYEQFARATGKSRNS